MADTDSGDKKSVQDSVNKAALDIAYGVYDELTVQDCDLASQRSLLWKIDLRLMPLM